MISQKNGFTLPLKWKFPDGRKYAFTFISLLVFLFAAYSNSFYGEWHFDDYYNIVANPFIKIENFSWDNIKHCIYGLEQKNPSRPLSYLSFALNHYLDGTNVFGYHVINFAIHYLAAVFLFLFIYNTLKLPLLKDRYMTIAYPVALLATFFWAINPVFVTSVTYIVQRMASMAGMFYIMSMYFYLKARTVEKTLHAVVLFACCTLSGLSAILSKENAATLPVTLLLFDLFLIQGASKDNIKKFIKIAALPLIIILFFGLIYTGGFSGAFGGYNLRDFTMGERLLTESRVIIFYISLLFYPLNSRLTLLYDIDISHSLLHPWTTLPAILLIFSALGLSFYFAKKRPLISFCIIFYFLNHAIEGSIFNLELIYEHRNYLPAMLLFVPLAVFLIQLLNYFASKKILQFLIILAMAIILTGMGDITYKRNAIFSDAFLLWLDNSKKYPSLSRTHSNLGNVYIKNGQKEKGLLEYEKAMSLNNFGGAYARAIQEHNLGLYKFAEGKYDESLPYFESSSKILPFYNSNIIHIAKIHYLKNESRLAINIIKAALEKSPLNSELSELLCVIMLREKRFSEAETCAKTILKNNLSNPFPLAVLAQTSKQKGNLQSAISLWKLYRQSYPNDPSANLALIELYAAKRDQKMLKDELSKLFCLKGNKSLSDYMKEKDFSEKNIGIYIPDYNSVKRALLTSLDCVL